MQREYTPIGAPSWIDVMSSDVAATRSFYCELFGWSAAEPNADFGGYFNFSNAGGLIAGGMSKDDANPMPDFWSVYIAVTDAAATTELVKAHGGQVIAEPMAVGDLGTMAVYIDPGGAGIGVWQAGEHKGMATIDQVGSPSWFELHTSDYDTSLAFYRDVFGWVTEPVSETPEFRYSVATGEGQWCGIMDNVNDLPEGTPATWEIYFEVDDVAATLAKAEALGAKLLHPAEATPYGVLGGATDPTGALFKLRTSPAG